MSLSDDKQGDAIDAFNTKFTCLKYKIKHL